MGPPADGGRRLGSRNLPRGWEGERERRDRIGRGREIPLPQGDGRGEEAGVTKSPLGEGMGGGNMQGSRNPPKGMGDREEEERERERGGGVGGVEKHPGESTVCRATR